MVEILVLSKITEAVVSLAANRILYLLKHEANSLINVKDDVENLVSELRRMQCFLRSAFSRQELDDSVKNLVVEVNNVANDIEDVIEIFIVKVESSYIKVLLLQKLRKEIDLIKARIKSIFKSRQNYGIGFVVDHPTASVLDRQRSFRRTFPDDNDDVISMESSIIVLKTRLLEENDDHLYHVVPIFGMGGIGKTTLAKKVYNDDAVKQHFDCCAWVFISQQYVLKDVLSEILIQVGFSQSQSTRNDPEEMLEERKRRRETLNILREDDLIFSIKDELRDKLYLLVLDDIWRKDDWDCLSRIFPNGKRGSRIVFTSRIMQLASYANPHDVAIEPPLLTSEGSWKLLRLKAFPSDSLGQHRSYQHQYEHLGKKMVDRCGGLPLAIVVLGGLLRTKSSYEEWQRVERDMNSHLNRHNQGVEDMLALSYHDLPYYLKPCLITEPTQGGTAEDNSEQCLGELIDRCIIQIVKRDYTGVEVKTFRVHHLMRHFCVSKAREYNFSEVIQQREENNNNNTTSSSSTYQTHSRRIAVHPGCSLDIRQMHSNLRSLTCFDASLSLKVLRAKNLKLLRVLKIVFRLGTRKCNVPSIISDLIHLRYLELSNAVLVILPNSIDNLRSLGIINLRNNGEVKLPAEILRLACLKQLLLPFNTCFPHSFRWQTYVLSKPTELQTLKYIRSGPLLLQNKITQSELTKLQNLGVQFTCCEDVRLFLAYPNFKFGMLKSLHMTLLSSNAFSNLEPLSKCVILQKLVIDGRMSDGQSLEFLPTSLTKLTMRDSDISIDPMPVLETLPSLMFLRLHNAYNGSEMVCGAHGFPKIETLQLFSLKRVTKLRVDLQTTMPHLKRLCIENMPNLRIIPEDLAVKDLKIGYVWLDSKLIVLINLSGSVKEMFVLMLFKLSVMNSLFFASSCCVFFPKVVPSVSVLLRSLLALLMAASNPSSVVASSSSAIVFSHTLSVKLDNHNFLLWRPQILDAICGHDLYDYIDSDFVPPLQ
ncbi:putative inactive disease susceptibility protein LOV1 [Humulus lupulus]|uniref:putative inactive disease susceptibility protein LOV1 n=1 Tax=Humulus lupulus TaxID=3486 RepID=UPI002B411962|nr:putative inactive disease susceptibility protein LOV1 [Humulus lupulus]